MESMRISSVRLHTPELTVSTVVPVFNREGTLDELVSRLMMVLSQGAAGWEIILVNDGSRNQSWPVIKQLSKLYPLNAGDNLI